MPASSNHGCQRITRSINGGKCSPWIAQFFPRSTMSRASGLLVSNSREPMRCAVYFALEHSLGREIGPEGLLKGVISEPSGSESARRAE